MFSLHKKVRQLGFTLIELMVVIAIIGVLAAAGLVAFTGAQKTARDSSRIQNVDAISTGYEQYFGTYGAYPVVASYAALGGTVVGGSTFAGTYFTQGMPAQAVTATYQYTTISATTGYCVCAGMEALGKGTSTAAATAATCPNFTAPGAAVQGYYCKGNQQ